MISQSFISNLYQSFLDCLQFVTGCGWSKQCVVLGKGWSDVSSQGKSLKCYTKIKQSNYIYMLFKVSIKS